MTHAAVVVSFNRKELLRECLLSLTEQTRMLDEIIVVDNGSTDGAAEMVISEFPQVTVYQSERNLGGAGGFAWGVELAIQRGHSTAWLMDDDGNPEPDAFEKLTDVFEPEHDQVSFAASLVTVSHGTPNELNSPEFSDNEASQLWAWQRHILAIDAATFVGVLINLDMARRTHLPIADFFIWGDDLEYTRRLTTLGYGVVVPTSQINHPVKPPATTPMGPRLYFLVRNGLWRRKEAVGGFAPWAGAVVEGLVATRHQLRLPGNPFSVLGRFCKGVWVGTFRSPRRVQPGELSATDHTVKLVREGVSRS